MFIIFMQNTRTGAEFALPVQAASREAALAAAAVHYPPEDYRTFTAYALPDLQKIVADAPRWPGVPSNVAAAKGVPVAVGGALPPMPGQRPAAPAPINPPNLLEALKAAAPTGAQVHSTPQAASPNPGALTLQQAMAALRGQSAPAAKPAVAQPAAAQRMLQPGPAATLPTTRSLSAIEVLRSLRG